MDVSYSDLHAGDIVEGLTESGEVAVGSADVVYRGIGSEEPLIFKRYMLAPEPYVLIRTISGDLVKSPSVDKLSEEESEIFKKNRRAALLDTFQLEDLIWLKNLERGDEYLFWVTLEGQIAIEETIIVDGSNMIIKLDGDIVIKCRFDQDPNLRIHSLLGGGNRVSFSCFPSTFTINRKGISATLKDFSNPKTIEA